MKKMAITRLISLILTLMGCCSEALAITYPPLGVPYSTGSQWGASYSVGTAGNNLVQLDSSGRLPALDGSQLFNLTGVTMVYPGAGVALSTGTGWGTSYTVGTAASNLVQLDSSARLPAVDGSQLTNLSSSMVYPGAGIPYSSGSAWGTSYTVGTAASNLVQLDSSARLPAVDGSQLTNLSSDMVYPGAGIPLSSGSAWSTSISAVNNGIVQFSSAGVPSAQTSIPTGTTVGGSYIYRVGGTDVAVADGGTGKSSWTLYGIPYASATTTLGVIPIGTAGQLLAVNSSASGYEFITKSSVYTFSTGLTNTSGTITNNLSTGVSGGQTIYGGTAASDNLNLISTTNSTSGFIHLLDSTVVGGDSITHALRTLMVYGNMGIAAEGSTDYVIYDSSDNTQKSQFAWAAASGDYFLFSGADDTIFRSSTSGSSVLLGAFTTKYGTASSKAPYIVAINENGLGIFNKPAFLFDAQPSTITGGPITAWFTRPWTSLTSTQISSLSGLVEGAAVWDSTNNVLKVYDGTALVTIGPGSSSYTFSTGLTNTSGTVTNNLSTGVSGGQTIYGGTAASDNLTLTSTTDTTTGQIRLTGNTIIGTGTAALGMLTSYGSMVISGYNIGYNVNYGTSNKSVYAAASGPGSFFSNALVNDTILRSNTTGSNILLGIGTGIATVTINAAGLGLFHKPVFLFDAQPDTIGTTSFTRPWTSLTSTEISSLANLVEGAAVWDSTNKLLKIYDGSNLVTIGPAVSGSYIFSTGLTNTSGVITNNLSTGISGGQTIYGGTAADDDLIVYSTTDSLKGRIYLKDRAIVGSARNGAITQLTVYTTASEGGIAIASMGAYPAAFKIYDSFPSEKLALGYADTAGAMITDSAANDTVLRSTTGNSAVLIGVYGSTYTLAVNATGLGIFNKPAFLFDVQPTTVGSTSFTRPWTSLTSTQISNLSGLVAGAALWDNTNTLLKVYDGSTLLSVAMQNTGNTFSGTNAFTGILTLPNNTTAGSAGQVAIDQTNGKLIINVGGDAGQQTLDFSGCAVGDTLVTDGSGNWSCASAESTGGATYSEQIFDFSNCAANTVLSCENGQTWSCGNVWTSEYYWDLNCSSGEEEPVTCPLTYAEATRNIIDLDGSVSFVGLWLKLPSAFVDGLVNFKSSTNCAGPVWITGALVMPDGSLKGGCITNLNCKANDYIVLKSDGVYWRIHGVYGDSWYLCASRSGNVSGCTLIDQYPSS